MATTTTSSNSENARNLREHMAADTSGAERAPGDIDAQHDAGKANRYSGGDAGEVVGMGGFNRAGGGVPGIKSDIAAMDVP